MRFFVCIFLLVSACLGAVLSVNDAFKITQGQSATGVYVEFTLGDEIFLYKKELKVALNGKDVTNLLNLPQAVNVKGEERFYKSLRLEISDLMLRRELEGLKNENGSGEPLNAPASLVISYQGCSNAGFCYRPLKANFKLENAQTHFKITPLSLNSTKEMSVLSAQSGENVDFKGIINDFKAEFKEFDKGFLLTLLSFFGYGLLLSLTPCTLPMVPILASLIASKDVKNGDTSGKHSSKAYNTFLCFIFVLFMSLAYAIAGVVTAALGASVALFLQTPLVLSLFALIFVLLALSCFGVFHFTMPFQNALNKLKFKGGGVFVVAGMGFLSALIIGPCTAAPLAAALLYIANTADIVLGASALFILSLGMGAPLLLIGLGVSFLKPGAWMARINVVLGFLMLFMVVFLLARFMRADFILMMYGVLGVFFASFMGLFETASGNFARFKKALLCLVLAYSLALFLGGLFGGKELLNPLNLGVSRGVQAAQNELKFKEIKSLDELRAEISASKKPVMLEFTATWCVNCQILKESVFKDERVLKRLEGFTLLRADITHSGDEELGIIKAFQAFAPPVLLFFKDGKQTGRIDGLINTDEFLLKLDDLN